MGVTFDSSRKLDKEGVKKEGSKFEIVDIGDFLPERVKKDMTRVSGSRFMVRKIDESMMDMETRLKTKVKELFHWAEDHGIERSEVTKMVTDVVEGGTLDRPVEAPTKRTTDAEPANEDGAAKHNGSETTMAPEPKCQTKKKKGYKQSRKNAKQIGPIKGATSKFRKKARARVVDNKQIQKSKNEDKTRKGLSTFIANTAKVSESLSFQLILFSYVC